MTRKRIGMIVAGVAVIAVGGVLNRWVDEASGTAVIAAGSWLIGLMQRTPRAFKEPPKS